MSHAGWAEKLRDQVLYPSSLGIWCYLADPLKEHVGLWPAIGLSAVPSVLRALASPTPRGVPTLHFAAALMYIVESAYVCELLTKGYRPEGWTFYVALMVPGFLWSGWIIRKRFLEGPPESRPEAARSPSADDRPIE